MGLQNYYYAKQFGRQLSRKNKNDPHAAYRYEHQFYICKSPSVCPRCKGWLGGLVVGTGGWVTATIVFSWNPFDLLQRFGLMWAYFLGALLLFLTPVHGMIGRMNMVRPDSWWETQEVLATIGGLSALAAPVIAAIVYGIWSA